MLPGQMGQLPFHVVCNEQIYTGQNCTQCSQTGHAVLSLIYRSDTFPYLLFALQFAQAQIRY